MNCNGAYQLGLPILTSIRAVIFSCVPETECLSIIAQSINRAFEETEEVVVVLENTAGQGSNVGYRFEQLAEIIDQVNNKKRIGVCLDTCHHLFLQVTI